MIQRGTREYALWSFGLAAVLIFAMVPVLWLVALSLKTPATVGDGRVIPADFTFENYESLFTGGFVARSCVRSSTRS